MFDKSLLTDTLSGLRYALIEQPARTLWKHVFKASWGTAVVEHFLYFELWGMPKRNLSCYFGLRNPEAEAFGVKSIQKYGGDLYRLMRHDSHTSCSLNFPLGKLASWKPRWSLDLSLITGPNFRERIIDAVAAQLFPIVRKVTERDHLLSFLLSNADSHAWHFTNGAIRAAQIANLAAQVGLAAGNVSELLMPYESKILACLARAPESSRYVQCVVRDSMCKTPAS